MIMITSSINGLIQAATQRYGKECEDVAKQGYNRILTCLFQSIQWAALMEQITLLEEKSAMLLSSPNTQLAGYAAIIGLAAASANPSLLNEYPLIKKGVRILHQNVGSLTQVISIATCVGMLYLGHVAYAFTFIGTYSFDLLAYKKVLPVNIRHIWEFARPFIAFTGLLITSNWIGRAILGVKILECIYYRLRKPMVPYQQSQHVSHLENFDLFIQVMNNIPPLKVNKDHVKIEPFPKTKLRKFESIVSLCHQFDWSESSTFKLLDEALQKDVRWLGFIEENKLEDLTDEIKINYLKRQFEILVNSVQNECIETGEPLNYEILKNYLGYLTENLQKAPHQIQRQILIQLAVEGGDYCGPGIYYQLEIAAVLLMQNGDKRLPLKQRILIILQQERLKVVQMFHQLSIKIQPVINFVHGGQGDLHAYNWTANVLGGDFGLPDQGAKQDIVSQTDFFDHIRMRFFVGLTQDNLWETVVYNKPNKPVDCYEGYTSHRVLEAVKEHLGLPLLSTQDIIDWALEWIENTHATQQQKDAFREQFSQGEFFTSNLKFKDEFLNALLVDFGILSL